MSLRGLFLFNGSRLPLRHQQQLLRICERSLAAIGARNDLTSCELIHKRQWLICRHLCGSNASRCLSVVGRPYDPDCSERRGLIAREQFGLDLVRYLASSIYV